MTPLRRYYRGHNLVAMRDVQAAATSYYHFDHQGTTQCLTNSAGTVTDRFASDAWGVQVKRTGTSINRQWYIGNFGYYRQKDQMLDYVRARYLDVMRARWLSVDPSSVSQGSRIPRAAQPSDGAFQYAQNFPVGFDDPSGRVCNASHWYARATDPDFVWNSFGFHWVMTMWAFSKTGKWQDLQNCAVVQYVEGSEQWGTPPHYYQVPNCGGVALANFPNWVVDSYDADPVYLTNQNPNGVWFFDIPSVPSHGCGSGGTPINAFNRFETYLIDYYKVPRPATCANLTAQKAKVAAAAVSMMSWGYVLEYELIKVDKRTGFPTCGVTVEDDWWELQF